MKAAFTQLQRISGNDVYTDYAKQICDSTLVDSMRIEEIILACVFQSFESFCGVKPDSKNYSTFINNLRWDLPDVPWSWTANP